MAMSALIVLLLVACLCASRVQSQSGSELMCPQQTTSGIHVSVNSLRNQRGNWITKLDLERGGGSSLLDETKTDPWSVALDSNTRSCEGTAESILHVSLTITAPLPKVGPDYELFPGFGYYKLHPEPQTFASALQTCAKEGTHVAIINSEKEDEIMKKLIKKYPNIVGATSGDWFWIGIERKFEEFVTIFGDGLNTTGFARWYPGQPDLLRTEFCVVVNRSNGGLGDAPCEWKVAFICEREIN